MCSNKLHFSFFMFLKLNYRPFGRFGDFNQYENTKRKRRNIVL